MPATDETTSREQIKTSFHRGENFESLYSNNVQFQPFEWDLKILFGELDVQPNKETGDNELIIDQHTAITIPWIQAKLAIYFLTLQVGIHEMTNGKLRIPKP